MDNFHDIYPLLFNCCTRSIDELSDNYNMQGYTFGAEHCIMFIELESSRPFHNVYTVGAQLGIA
jgi:hypothetical protein